MKKILSILSTVALVGTTAALAISCTVPSYRINIDVSSTGLSSNEEWKASALQKIDGVDNSAFSSLSFDLINLLAFRPEMVVKPENNQKQLRQRLSQYKTTKSDFVDDQSIAQKTIDGTYFGLDINGNNNGISEEEYYNDLSLDQANTFFTQVKKDNLNKDFEKLYLNNNSADKGFVGLKLVDGGAISQYSTPTLTSPDNGVWVGTESGGQAWAAANPGWDNQNNKLPSPSEIALLGNQAPQATDLSILKDNSETPQIARTDWSILFKNVDAKDDSKGLTTVPNQSHLVNMNDLKFEITYASDIKKVSKDKGSLAHVDAYTIDFTIKGLGAVFVPTKGNTIKKDNKDNKQEQVFWAFDHYQWNQTWNVGKDHVDGNRTFKAGEGLFESFSISDWASTKLAK